MSGFSANDRFTRAARDRYLRSFYDKITEGGQYAFCDGKSRGVRAIQKLLHIDTVAGFPDGGVLTFDEKIRVRRYDDFVLETKQSTVTDKDGWIYTSHADRLLYAFPKEKGAGLDLYVMRMEDLQDWFNENGHRYQRRIGVNEPNEPEFIAVPMKDIFEAMLVVRFFATKDTCVQVRLPIACSKKTT